MKTAVNYLMRFAPAILALFCVSTLAIAGGNTTEVYLTGTTNTAAGSFVVQATDDIYQYQGDEYTVYNVYYDNPKNNMKIAVLDEGDCESYIAFTKDYWFQYNCTREGFGVRKARFRSPTTRDMFDSDEYHDQTILLKKRNIEKDQAVGIIATYMPRLQG